MLTAQGVSVLGLHLLLMLGGSTLEGVRIGGDTTMGWWATSWGFFADCGLFFVGGFGRVGLVGLGGILAAAEGVLTLVLASGAGFVVFAHCELD